MLGWPLRAIKAQKNFAEANNVGDAQARKTCQFPMAFLAGGPMTGRACHVALKGDGGCAHRAPLVRVDYA